MPDITRYPDETWRDCAARYGRRYGLESEVLRSFDRLIATGVDPETAALDAAGDWDCWE